MATPLRDISAVGSMFEDRLRILQVSRADLGGGAEAVAWRLFREFRARGESSRMAVGRKQSDDADVTAFAEQGDETALSRMATLPKALRRRWDIHLGIEDFHHPSSHLLLADKHEKLDIVHCHNLHGGYFDLRILPRLSQQTRLVLTLHDAWLLSGHCAHSFGCERWKIGCGSCPDLTIYPAIRRDATAYNWRRKRDIYAASRLHVVTPCRWLMERVEESMLAPGIVESIVIPNGVDLDVFRTGDKVVARSALNIPGDVAVLLFAANGVRGKRWRDYEVMREAAFRLGERIGERKLILLALGEDAEPERHRNVEIRFIPHQRDPEVIARHYRAADIYLHAARADTFPTSVLEALACGVPVIATAVGGIPEQVRGLRPLRHSNAVDADLYEVGEATGFLTRPGDSEAMAEAALTLLEDADLKSHLGRNAAHDARRRFDFTRCADMYLDWYRSIVRSPSFAGQVM